MQNDGNFIGLKPNKMFEMGIKFFLISLIIPTFGKTIDIDIHLDVKTGNHNSKKKNTYLNDNPGFQPDGRVTKTSRPIHFKAKDNIEHFGDDLSGRS